MTDDPTAPDDTAHLTLPPSEAEALVDDLTALADDPDHLDPIPDVDEDDVRNLADKLRTQLDDDLTDYHADTECPSCEAHLRVTVQAATEPTKVILQGDPP